MRRLLTIAGILLSLTFTGQAFGQSSSATLSGTVSDAANALIPGVTITATNTETAVVSTAVTNETGTYNIPSLLPGIYNVSAELPGFQTQTFTGVRLGNAAQARLNITMRVANVNTAIEVTVAADQLLIESTSSVGAVLPEKTVQDLPIVGVMGNDALNLVRTLPGLNLSNDLIFAANDSKLAGVSAANVQIQRDGVDASASGRWPAGIQGATIMNPDLIGEVRMILSPVDAELGRGNSQIQIQTRSGTNNFHGAGVWNIRNSALDPNLWANNRVQPVPATRDWTNINEYTGSVGGPIVKNKTFFFALWDGLIPLSRTNVNAIVLTPCARNGVFRYFDGWANGNILQPTQPTGANPTIAVVDFQGNARTPATNPNGTPFNGALRYYSVFGPLANTPTKPDCSDAIVQGSPWDANRNQMDPTGYVKKMLGVMPLPNNYEVGEGLNTAGFRWVKRVQGGTNRFGFGQSDVRKQINVKIDHNFDTKNKINAGWSYEASHSDYATRIWPTGFDGIAHRSPQVLTVNFTSTLTPTLLNEARFGMRRTGTNTTHGLANPATKKDALAFVPNPNGIPVLPQLGVKTTPWSDTATFVPLVCVCGGQPNLSSQAGNAFNGNISEKTPLYTYADSVTWTKATHTFKGGIEVRFAHSQYSDDVDSNNWSSYARAFGGDSPLSPTQNIDSAHMTGLQGTATSGNNYAMRGLLSLLSGSLSQVTELYWLGSSKNLDKFEDYRTAVQRVREINQKEMSVFFKDDWKVKRDLTLNLGLRWDYYGVPWISNGLTTAPAGGGNALFGYSGRGFQDWMKPGQRGDLTQLIFVGPDSPNPDLRPWPKDFHNFGPAIGFAWQVPWFGVGQTTVRGGYQVSFLPGGGGRFSTLSGALANPPGSSYDAIITGGPGLEYLDMTKLSSLVPVPVSVKPMQPIPVTDRTVSFSAFDPHFTTPYVQNLTMAITRNVGSRLTVDTRYIGTLSRKLYGSIDLNSSNFLYNGLKEAFDAARAGGESAVLNQIFNGINIAGAGFGAVGTTFNGVPQTGALHLRGATAGNLRNNLANGNYLALANSLATLNYSQAGGLNSNLPVIPTGVNGAVLRFNGFPENFIKASPQFSTAPFLTNSSSSNYHSLQAQVTLRPAAGVSFQTSYTWSKLLGYGSFPTTLSSASAGGTYTNPVDRKADYSLQPGDIRHDFRTNGSFALPFGPNKLLMGGSHGVLARAVENWQMSWIVDLSSGAPANILAQSMLYANGVPDIVGKFNRKGKAQWPNGALTGNYFGNAYTKVPDPQCRSIVSSLQSLCTLNAIADNSGTIVLQNPLPGRRGTLGQNVIEVPGVWSLDTSMSKAFQIREGKFLRFRMDATNILNHPQPVNPSNSPFSPDLNINSAGTKFGDIPVKTGARQFQAQLRLEF
jgi:hypothetical protein